MIRHRLAIALMVFSTLALASGGLARADDLRTRYRIDPSTGMIIEGRFSGNRLASVRPVGQARMVQLRDGNYYWLSPPQAGLPPVPVLINAPQPGSRGSAPETVRPRQPSAAQRRLRIEQIEMEIRSLEYKIRDQERSNQEYERSGEKSPSVTNMMLQSSARGLLQAYEDKKMRLEMEKARLESEP